MGSLARALQVLHSRTTPVTRRDIKLENLLVTKYNLVTKDNVVKLYDLESATTAAHSPN